jgi:hypothetical protein
MDALVKSFVDSPLLSNPIFWIGVLFGEIILLFIYYPIIERKISFISSRLFGGNTLSVYYFFFMGTVIHELSHLLGCILLFVRVGKVNFFGPKEDKNGEGYTLGYVEHAVTDPFRGTLIGIAPIFGSALMTYLMFVWAGNLVLFHIPTYNEILGGIVYMFQNPFHVQNFLFLYLLVSCAMSGNPSKADLQSLPMSIGVFAVLGFLVFLMKNSINWGAVGSATSQMTFLAPPLMMASMIMAFEIFVLVLIHISSKFILRGWGYRG